MRGCFKHWFACVVLAGCAGDASLVNPAPDAAVIHEETCDGARTLRALFVGNSQIYWADLPHIVEELAASAPAECPRIETESFARGGANLRDLWEEPTDGRSLETTIAEGGYDVVVIAESIDLVDARPSPYPQQFVDYASIIVHAAQDSGAMPVLLATAYVEMPEHAHFDEMAEPQIALAHELGARVAAGGLAWLRAWNEQPDLALYADDHAHPSWRGSYLSGLVVYSTITGASPLGLSSAAGCNEDSCVISSDEAELYQRAAWAQVMATGR